MVGQRAYPRSSADGAPEYPRVHRRCGWAVDNSADTTDRVRPSAAHRKHLDSRQIAGRRGTQLRVAVVADAPDPADDVAQLRVGSLGPEHRSEIVAVRGEETGIELALRRDAGTGAIAAERGADRRDQTDLTGAVPVAPARRHLAPV